MLTKWSPTAIRQTKSCKRLFEKKYIEKAPVEVAISEFEEGHRMHNACEQYLRTGNESYLVDIPEQTQQALKFIKSWKGELYIEKEFDDEWISGVADIVFGGDNQWIVIDIKTRYDSDINDDDLVQLYTYLYFLQRERFKEKCHIGVLAIHNQFKPLNIIESKLKTVDELEQYLKHQIELAERRLKHININTAYCKYCEYILSCDAVEEKPSDIKAIAQKYIQLKTLVSQYEAILKEHVNRTGENLIVDGNEIGMHVRNNTTVDLKSLVTIASTYHLSVAEMMKPDVTAIKKLAKQYPELANAIHVEQDYYFSIKKVKE